MILFLTFHGSLPQSPNFLDTRREIRRMGRGIRSAASGWHRPRAARLGIEPEKRSSKDSSRMNRRLLANSRGP